MARKQPGWHAVPRADRYVEYILYDLLADPHQHVNLAGLVPYQKTAEKLRAHLLAGIHDPAAFPRPSIHAGFRLRDAGAQAVSRIRSIV